MPRETQPKESRPTTPAAYPVTTPQYSTPDYSFTLQAIMELKGSVGQLTQAVTTLTEQSKEHDKKLDEIGKDVHGAKVAGKALLWVVGVVGALLGILINLYLKWPALPAPGAGH